jgi:serine/threonine protein kinase/cytochrome c-type biogenesis protein CcmH/NrfG
MTEFNPFRFGKYLILGKIATGGMAELFQAKITSVEGFEKLVAIKKILPNLTQDKNLVNMFIDEAKLAAMLTHQNIVQIYDLGSMEGAYFIAMEYIRGKDLRIISNKSKAKELPIPIEYALFITCRICSGLDYSHNFKDFQGNTLKLIHRDISPQNILVTYEGEIKIVDFGIAKAAKESSDTEDGLIKGKVAYMSPEQAAGKTMDHRSDIFSTGLLLYEMVTGKRVFEGSDLKVLDLVRKADFQPAETIVTDLPPEVIEILDRALAKAPSRRYKSCAAMLAELEECLSSFSVRPSAEGLSQYMKDLFAEEIAAEASALQQVGAEVYSFQEEATAEESTKTLRIMEKIAPAPSKKPETASSTYRLWLGTWAFAMVIIAIVLALLFKQRSVPTPGKDEQVAMSQTSEMSLSSKVAPSPPPAGDEPAIREQALEALRNERFAKAAALFEEALNSEPGDRPKIAAPYAQALVGGAVSILASNPRQAEALLSKAAAVDPQNAKAFFYLGKLYTSEQKIPKAIKAYGKATALDPRSPDAFFNLGFIYYSSRDYPEAEEMFQKAIALKPPYLDEVYVNLAVVQNLQGKKEESIRNLEQALKVNPNNDIAKKYLLRFKRTSQNNNEANQLENHAFGIARTGTPMDLCRLCFDGQICRGDQRKTSLLGQTLVL